MSRNKSTDLTHRKNIKELRKDFWKNVKVLGRDKTYKPRIA